MFNVQFRSLEISKGIEKIIRYFVHGFDVQINICIRLFNDANLNQIEVN